MSVQLYKLLLYIDIMDVSRHSFNCLVSVENIGRNMTYTMAAEVGLLTRNIKVIGEPYPDQLSEAFGARMLVGTYQDDRLYIGRLEIRLCICNAILRDYVMPYYVIT